MEGGGEGGREGGREESVGVEREYCIFETNARVPFSYTILQSQFQYGNETAGVLRLTSAWSPVPAAAGRTGLGS